MLRLTLLALTVALALPAHAQTKKDLVAKLVDRASNAVKTVISPH